MKTAVIYSSRQGSTRKYAELIAQELAADIFDISEITAVIDLSIYQNIIFGMPIYSGTLYGCALINKKFPDITDKNLFLFIVGMTPINSRSRQLVLISSLPKKIRECMHIYHFRGDYDFLKLNYKGRVAANMLHSKLESRRRSGTISEEEIILLQCLCEKQKWLNKTYAYSLVRDVYTPPTLPPRLKQAPLFYFDENGQMCQI